MFSPKPVRDPYFIQRLSLDGHHLVWDYMGDLYFESDSKIAFQAMLESDLMTHRVLIGVAHKSVALHIVARKDFPLADYVSCIEKVLSKGYLLCQPAYLREKLESMLGLTRQPLLKAEKINVWLDVDNLALITLNGHDAASLLQVLYEPPGRLVI